MLRRIAAAALCLLLLLSSLPVTAKDDPHTAVRDFLSQNALVPTAGDTYGDWGVFALARSGATVPKGYFSAYLTMVERLLDENGGKLTGPTSGNLRLALALLALGQDLTDVGGHDLTPLIRDTDRVCKTTVMGPTFALIVLNNMGGDDACEKIYVQHLLDKQLADGGWALSGKISDPDATAMALQALSFYQKDKVAKKAIDTGLKRLSSMQLENGGFTAWGSTAAESISQTIMALCMLDIDVDDARFVKKKGGLTDALLRYQLKDGAFRHVEGGDYDVMATQQATLALNALQRREDGEAAIYHLTDPVKVDRKFVGLPGRDKVIKVPKKSTNTVTFSDISGLDCAKQIRELAARGIINGMGGSKFEPQGKLNRAQFCALAVRALTLPMGRLAGFSDVPAGQWYTDAVNAAAAFGAVEGMGQNKFAPEANITRQQAAVLMARLAKKCGMNTEYNDTACKNILAQFGDSKACASWARSSLAFCYDAGILDDSVLNINPEEPVTRGEAAAMFYALLDGALLLEN